MREQKKVIGCVCTITFDIDFDMLAEKLDVSEQQIHQLWNTDELADYVNSRLTPLGVLELGSDTPVMAEVDIGNGYLGSK